MKREIKFRGKRVDNGEWVYGDLLQTEITEIFKDGSLHKVIPETVGQFTGLKDKNGVEIYEGDICIYPHTDCENVTYKDTYQVVYKTPCFKLKAMKSHIFKSGAFINLFNTQNTEVIGNIHDNKQRKLINLYT